MLKRIILLALTWKINDNDLPFCDNSVSRRLYKAMKNKTDSDASIALVKAAFAEPFRIAMENNGVTAEDYFRKNSLPLAPLDDPDSLVPEKPFWRLVNQVAISEGIPDFGMQVARAMPWYQIETLHTLLAAAPDLGTMLRSFCELARGQSSASNFVLTCKNGVCHFESTAIPLIGNDMQMEFYRVTSMIELVQVHTGPNWHPQAVSLLMKPHSIAGTIDILAGCKLQFEQPRTAIHFAECLLESFASLENAPLLSKRKLAAETGKPEEKTDLIPALKEILGNYISEPNLSIELVADLAGLTPRSLQRALKAQGSSYRGLLNKARRNYAQQLLHDTDVRALEIASQLGYREAGHFTRAFKRWTGVTPSEFRRRTK